jgi:Protein of unknown function (DUF2934)
VPKKKKTAQVETAGGPLDAAGSPSEMKTKKTSAVRRTPTTRKNSAARVKSVTARKIKVYPPAEAGQRMEPSDEQIRVLAYFISERRRRFALPGDADSDWLEARRQLLSDTHR